MCAHHLSLYDTLTATTFSDICNYSMSTYACAHKRKVYSTCSFRRTRRDSCVIIVGVCLALEKMLVQRTSVYHHKKALVIWMHILVKSVRFNTVLS
jgi:hypothetical protein